MDQLPNLVRNRLQADLDSNHPQADLLNAFAEGALSERERGPVLEHICRCPECRQVLALALPESTALPVTAMKTVWFRWPVVRWGALAACVVVVGAAVTFNLKTKQGMNSYPPAPQSARLETSPPLSPPEQTRSETKTKLSEESPSRTLAKRIAPPRSQTDAAMILPKGMASPSAAPHAAPAPAPPGDSFDAVAGKTSKAEVASGIPVPELKAPTVTEMVAVEPASDEKATVSNQPAADTQASNQTVEVVAGIAPAKKEMPSSQSARSNKASAPRAEGIGAQARLDANSLANTAATTSGGRILNDLSQARWTLSSDGLPQRSLDSGKTWEKIQVDHSRGFRALSAVALDVWVGGVGGVLYHSSDVGMHWTRINAICDGAPLTADIARLEFTDALHGRLTSADQRSWTTVDGGKTWQQW